MKFYEAGKIPPTPHMYFVYGDGGTGKTSLFKDFEGKKLLFSFDLSTNVLIGDESIDVFKLEERDMATIQSNLGDLLGRAVASRRYQAICLDNVTALQNMVLENIDGASKDNRQNYQKLQLWFRQMGTHQRDSDVTVYATAHQIDNGPDKMQGRFAADMFDLVGRIYVKNGERLIDLDPEQGNHAKNRIDDRTLIKANELIKKEEDQ